MDIRCPSCSTLYEFEEEKIGPKGVNVRCSACGQVFKVRRAVAVVQEHWVVKRESTGERIEFEDLSTLQRWIVEQKVSRRDLISKTGDSWSTLGSINELAAFFKVVDELNEPRNASRDTDGYLTANQRAPQASPGRRATGYTPTPPPTPAVEEPTEPSINVAAIDDDTATPPTSPKVEEEYSMGGADFWDEPPPVTFDGPSIDERSASYTGEYALNRASSRRWPVVLLALLLLLAGVVVIVTALGGESGEDAEDEDAIAADTSESGDGASADGGSGDEEGSGRVEGSGLADGSGGDDAASEDEQSAEQADDPEEPEAAEEQAPARTEPPAREETTPEPQRTPPPQPAAEREPEREEPPEREPEPPAEPEQPPPATGYDAMMEAGNTSLRAGNYQDALNQFSNATDARPNSAEAHVGVARAYEAMGRHDLAAVRYERATNVNSRYTPAWLGLGEARRASGDIAGACTAYARVLSIVRAGSSAERARSRMGDLGCE